MKQLTLYSDTEFQNGRDYSIHWWNLSYTYYHRHSGFYELILTNKPLLHTIEGEEINIPEHSLVLIKPMVYHKLTDKIKNANVNHFNLSIKIEHLNTITGNHSLNNLFKTTNAPMVRLSDEEYAYFFFLAEKLIYNFNDIELCNEYLSLYITAALSTLKIHKLKNRSNENTSYAEILKNKLDNFKFLNKSIAEFYNMFPITSAELISDFKQLTGLTIVGYVTKKRIMLACNLLANTHLSLEQISYKIGYNSVSHFIRVFKKEKKMTPSEYRASQQI